MLISSYFVPLVLIFVAKSSGQIHRLSSAVLNSGECPSSEAVNPRKQALRDEIAGILANITAGSPPCPCGGAGNWTQVANLQLNGTTQQCPINWNLITTPVRGCGRSSAAAKTCDSAFFSARGRTYSRVCGKVIGYQRGDPNAFNSSISANVGLESYYIDGISLTHGSPGRRQHIWSFVAARNEDAMPYRANWTCACTRRTVPWPYTVPQFVGNDYFCATAHTFGDNTALLTDDPLWDGVGCGPLNDCCEFNSPPWFCTSLPQPTSDSLELRLCHDQTGSNEDTIVSQVELYIL